MTGTDMKNDTRNKPAPWWGSLTGLLYFAANCGLIYVFLLWPLQIGAELTMRSIIIWLVLSAFAALLYLWARRSSLGAK